MLMIHTVDPGDQELLEGLRRSDRRAVEAVYDLALPAVIRWVKENNGSEADARDIYQEALIAVFRKLEGGDFQLTCTLKSFLRILCRNLWLARLRNRRKREMRPLEGVEAVELDQDLEARLERSERDQLFFRHFDALGEKCRQILLWFFDKVPLREIAARMDTTEQYIKKRKFTCKEKLLAAVQADPLYEELKGPGRHDH